MSRQVFHVDAGFAIVFWWMLKARMVSVIL